MKKAFNSTDYILVKADTNSGNITTNSMYVITFIITF